MVTYVLGAGASCHAGYPLTDELGNHLCDWVRQNWKDNLFWKGYIEALQQHYGGLANLEVILTELYEHPAGSRAAALTKFCRGQTIGALKVAIPEFFNGVRQNTIVGPDLYKKLAQDHVRKGDAILTFNYDLAAEHALRAEELWQIGDGYGFSLGAGITPASDVKMLKLHGSTNWLGILFNGAMGMSQASSVYGLRPTLFRQSDFKYLGYQNHICDLQWKGTTGGDPALILPTLHKNFFHQTLFGREWQPFWDDVWGQAEQALQASSKVVIIGYSMPAADERARGLLLKHSNSTSDILIFSGSRTGSICEEFRQCGFQTVKSSGKGRFEDFLSS